jgi:spermidine dehydrogenase
MSHEKQDRALGMQEKITRRDFLNGVSVALGVSLLAANPLWLEAFGVPQSPLAQEKDAGYYPPAKTGMRGSHDGSWEVAHALRDGTEWPEPVDDNESYDLIVVGAGISGLAAAYFYRKSAGKNARILLLDNHDDFGGHAKRNEFQAGNRLLLGYGGTQSIEAPAHYSKEAIGLLKELGIDVRRFYKYYDRKLFDSMKLGQVAFFDKETFGVDRLVPEADLHYEGPGFTAKTAAQLPIAEAAQHDIIRLQETAVEYFPDLNPEQKRAKLIKISYKDFLLQYVKVHPDVVKVFQTATHDLYAVGVDAVSAYDCARYGYPGFRGITLPKRHREDDQEEEEPYIFHFPDGNASIARMLVRSLVPGVLSGETMEDIVTARANYARLDDAASRVRVRLNSTAVRAKHIGDPATAKEVEVTYVRGGQPRRVRAANCVLACYNMVIPYLCPEMPEKQNQRSNQQLEILPETRHQRDLRAGSVLQQCDIGLSSVHGRLSVPQFAR